MKRSPTLVSLSRDHHRALATALKLRRASAETAGAARAAALRFWEEAGRRHFRLEEEVLLPAFAGHGDARHPLVARALCDHVVIRHRIDQLAAAPSASAIDLHELGVLLAEHVRLEERELFVLIEQTLPPAQLKAVAASLERADRACSGQATPE